MGRQDDREAERAGAPASGEPAPFDRERTWNYLLFILARRMYTVDELRTKLRRRGVPAADGEGLLERLAELRLVDDPTYAEQYVRSRMASRGKFALRRELRRKGVATELIEQELGGLDEAQQREAAVDLLRRNVWRYRPRPPEHGADQPEPDDGALEWVEDEQGPALSRLEAAKARAKAFAFLARRGFGAGAAKAAMDEVGWFEED